MAKSLGDIVRDVASGLTPVVVGLVLVNNKTLIPFLPEVVHLWGGWLVAIVGGYDLFVRLTK